MKQTMSKSINSYTKFMTTDQLEGLDKDRQEKVFRSCKNRSDKYNKPVPAVEMVIDGFPILAFDDEFAWKLEACDTMITKLQQMKLSDAPTPTAPTSQWTSQSVSDADVKAPELPSISDAEIPAPCLPGSPNSYAQEPESDHYIKAPELPSVSNAEIPALCLPRVPNSYAPGPESNPYAPGPESDPYAPGPESNPYAPGPESALYAPGPELDLYAPGPESDLYAPGPESDLYAPGPESDLYAPGPETDADIKAPGLPSISNAEIPAPCLPRAANSYAPGPESNADIKAPQLPSISNAEISAPCLPRAPSSYAPGPGSLSIPNPSQKRSANPDELESSQTPVKKLTVTEYLKRHQIYDPCKSPQAYQDYSRKIPDANTQFPVRQTYTHPSYCPQTDYRMRPPVPPYPTHYQPYDHVRVPNYYGLPYSSTQPQFGGQHFYPSQNFYPSPHIQYPPQYVTNVPLPVPPVHGNNPPPQVRPSPHIQPYNRPVYKHIGFGYPQAKW